MRQLRLRWKSILLFLSIAGPGIITSNVDNDAGGIATYSMAGAHFGYSLLWSLVPIMLALMIVQEMSARMGVVTGKGLSDLIRERFGVKITVYLLFAVVLTNIGNIIAEFAGVASSLEIFRVSKYLSVPLAAAAVWLLVIKGTYRSIEKVFLSACLFYLTYILAGFLAKPDWAAIGRSFVRPHFDFSSVGMGMIIGLIGTTIAPWMQFYLQASIVEKNIALKNYRFARWDVIIGSVIVTLIAAFIVLTCAATLFPAGVRVETAADAAQALRPLAGKYTAFLFAFGLLNASLFAASILPLSTAFVVCEAMGWENGVDKKFSQAPQFYGLYSMLIVLGAAIVLIPGIPLFPVMYISQVVNGAALPLILVFMLILTNDKKLMGEYVNKKGYNIIAWSTIVILVALTMIYLGLLLGIL
ncbi:MAG: Nramp family divalent metal transporter [Acidobacteriota bacterium]|nr:Nramp family divalent metal transporter [Acidobacteriota bacterium]OQB56538.1 MAG: Divalent metal cation transporter MntH [Candidatus Aminicenantes bacterium ADurb.Bin147]HNQ80039.1 Nramp family divalent metal transporter [Candidatus Aminicenantes bacterium]MDD8032571.1 Nramp family divalent metal transporter [Acidobacteriota bacterium]MDD8039656.1 Nramp family divalent metal transporter [Acidobacteriota bacterium]